MNIIYKYLQMLWHRAAEDNNKTLASYVKPARHAKILDIGVFRGDLIIERVRNISKPEIYATDIDSEAIKSCRKLGIKAKLWDIEKGFPYKSNFFDIVSANQIIEHLVDIDLFVQEIHRVLKPGGYLVISTENLSSWHNIFALCLGWQAFSQQISAKNTGNPIKLIRLMPSGSQKHDDLHNKIFTLYGLIELFKSYNFEITDKFGAGYYPFPHKLSKILALIDPFHAPFIGLKARKI